MFSFCVWIGCGASLCTIPGGRDPRTHPQRKKRFYTRSFPLLHIHATVCGDVTIPRASHDLVFCIATCVPIVMSGRLLVGISLFCFYFHLFFFLAILLFSPIMLKILLEASILYSQLSNITSYLTVTSYTCMVLVNANFNKAKCGDCSIRVYWSFSIWVATWDKHLGGATLPFAILYCCISF